MNLMRKLTALLVCLGPLLASCATIGIDSSRAATPNGQAGNHLLLTNRENTLRLIASPGEIGPIQLLAFGETLLGGGAAFSPGGVRPLFRVAGKTIPSVWPGDMKPDPILTGSEWQYASVKPVFTNAPAVQSHKRHFLFVEPDLVVILDELSLTDSAPVETGFWFSFPPSRDALRDEWTVQTPSSGLTARFLTSPKSRQEWVAMPTPSVANSSTNSAPGCVRSLVSESGAEFYQITILVIHPDQTRRSLAFKLLESDTAIGARIHRDGLPTLVAFRKTSCVGEANLTGLKFTASVAVDVFRPRKKK